MPKSYTESDILNFLTQAVKRELNGDPGGYAWVFHREMDDRARLAFDLFLVRTDDELAYSAGTTESRFRTRVRRMVELERERLLNSDDLRPRSPEEIASITSSILDRDNS